MRGTPAASLKEQFFDTANQALGAGMFWRGSLARAVQKRDFKGTILGVALLSFFLFLYVWQHMQVVKLSYEVQALRNEKQRLTNQYYYLQYQMYDVNSLTKVEKTAREQLGMVTPKSDQIVIMNGGSSPAPRWFSWWTQTMDKRGKR